MTPEMNTDPIGGQPNGGSATGFNGQTPQASSQTPWPQYGEVSGSSNPTYGSYAGGTSNGAGAGYPQGAQAQWNSDAPQYPGQSMNQPMGQPYAGQQAGGPNAAGMPMPGVPQKLPSRAGSIIMMVVGLLMMFIVAPISLLAGTLGGLDLDGAIAGTNEIRSGDTITIGEGGSLIVATSASDPSASAGTLYSCEVTSVETDTEYKMSMSTTDTFYIDGLAPGDYVVECEGETTRLMAISGVSAEDLVGAGMSGLAWATGIGILGLLLLIGGIIWLVMTNRKRSQIRATQMGSPYQWQ